MILPPTWRQPLLALAALWAGLLLLFLRDAAHLVALWWTSSTFTHCLFILPIIGWLLWLRRKELAKLDPHAWWPGLIWMAAGAAAWFVGDVASVALARHLGLVLMLQGCVPTLLGPQVTRAVAFPLFYALFLVPAGEELVPPMQTLTAEMAMALLRVTGIPAYLEGIFITTPRGYFAVAEACSGVKFLVAMAALAVLVAHLCFRSWRRRIAFLSFALIVPLIANGLRATSTIWIAEHWGRQFAVGADHVIYGWFFFGLVMALVGWVSSPFFDRAADAVPIDGDALRRTSTGASAPLAACVLAAAALALMPVALDHVAAARARALPACPELALPGWAPAGPVDDWQPHYAGSDRRCSAHLVDASGQHVDVTLVGFHRQHEGGELVGYGQGAVPPDSDWAWGAPLAPIGPARVDRISREGKPRDVMTLYRIHGTTTASGARVKLATLRARLTGGDERGYALVIGAPAGEGQGGRDAIARYLAQGGGSEAMLARLTSDH
jgi:exosortase A